MPGSRDRIIDVLAGRLPDRVPYFELLIHGGVISQMHPGADCLDGPIHSMQDMHSSRPPDPLAEEGFQDLRKALARSRKDRMVAFYSKGTFNHT